LIKTYSVSMVLTVHVTGDLDTGDGKDLQRATFLASEVWTKKGRRVEHTGKHGITTIMQSADANILGTSKR